MKQVDIKTRVIPNKPRSGNYPVGSTVVRGGSTGGDTTIINQGGADLSTLRQQFLSKKNDDTAQGIINFLKGIKIAGNAINQIITSNSDVEADDNSVMTALKTLAEISKNNESLKDIFLRKDQPDSTNFLLSLFGGAIFGKDGFASGATGFGAKIDDRGYGEMRGLTLWEWLQVPELRYNRVEIIIGDKWRAPGGGIIETCTPDTDEEGNTLLTGTCTLKLEDGEYGSVSLHDLNMGIYHFGDERDATEDSDDSKGNFTFAGFATCYFVITEVVGDNNGTFRYSLRPGYNIHPYPQMHFTCRGNIDNEERQTAVYETRTYTRMLWKLNTWEIGAQNIAMQFGDLTNLNVFGMQMNGYSMYLNSVYFTGTIIQMKPDGTPVQTANDRGEWVDGTRYDFYDRVSHNGSIWLCVNEDGTTKEPSEDNPDWLLQVSGGSGGKYTKFIYKWSDEKPATPDSTLNPSGWSMTTEATSGYSLDSVTGDFTLTNGWYRSPSSTSNSAQYVTRVNFTTYSDNVTIDINVEVSSESNYDFGYVSKLDTAFSTSNYNYRGSGVASKTVSVTVASAGSHYLEFAYTKDSSNSSNEDMFRFKFVSQSSRLWMSQGIVTDGSETVEWSDPVPFSGLDGQQGPKGEDGKDGTNGTNGTDGADGSDGEEGAIARYRGIYSSSETYIYGYENNILYRDIVVYNENAYQVKTKGDSVYNVTPSSSSSRWEQGSKFSFVAMDTALINNANVAGFTFRKIGEGSDGTPYGELRSQSTDSEGDPTLYMNTKTGFLHCSDAEIKGKITATSGQIGGITINSTYIGNNANLTPLAGANFTLSNNNFYIGYGDLVSSIPYVKYVKINPSSSTVMEISVPEYLSSSSTYALKTEGNILFETKTDETVEIHGMQCNVRRLSSSATINANDDFIRTTTSLTLTAPSASSLKGKRYYIKCTGGNVTLRGSSFLASNSSSVVSSVTLNDGVSYIMISDGYYWCIFYCG